VNGPTIKGRTAGDGAAMKRDPSRTGQCADRDIAEERSHWPQDVSVDAGELGIVRVAETRSALHDRRERRLQVRGRAANNAQDLARGGLLLERLAEVSIAGF